MKPFHPWCRCTTVPYYEDMKGLGERWMRDPDTDQSGYVPSDMTYKEWKEIYVDKTSTMEEWQAKRVDFSDESGIIKQKENHVKDSNKQAENETLFSKSSRNSNASLGADGFSKESRENLYQQERILSENKYESAILYDAKGNVIFRKDGDSKSVTFSKEEIQQMNGCVLTHNHPNGSVFSEADINMLRLSNLSEIRACTSDGTYSLKLKDKWSETLDCFETIETEYWKAMNDVGDKYKELAAKRGKSILFYLKEMDEDGLKLFSERHGLVFSWEAYK